MADLISRAAAKRAINDYKNSMIGLAPLEINRVVDIFQIIQKLPAVDAAPVRHGRWMGRRYDFKEYKYVIVPYDVTTFDNPDDLFCSVCNEPALSNGAENDVPSNYCPHCWAKMDMNEGD